MAYGRHHSRSVRALLVAATLCDYWIIGLAMILIASPVQPKLHFAEVGETCVYLGRTGWSTGNLNDGQSNCPILRFYLVR